MPTSRRIFLWFVIGMALLSLGFCHYVALKPAYDSGYFSNIGLQNDKR